MGFLGIGKSRINMLGNKARGVMLGTGKVMTTVGKGGQIAGKAGLALTPAVTAFNPAAGLVLGGKSAKLYAAGSIAKVGGRALKKGSKGKIKKFDAKRALLND